MRTLLPLFFTLFATLLSAQEDCFYQLQLLDSGGDGINGGRVTITVGDDDPREYTLDAMQDDGSRRDFFFPVRNGQQVTVGYRTGAFPEEVSLRILDNNDSLVYTIAAPTTAPELTAFTANCRTCAPPPFSSIELYRVRYNSVDIRFRATSASASPTYLIEYAEGDFDPQTQTGTRLTTQDTMLRISGLSASTEYTFYVSTICSNPADTTARRGPFRIRTQVQKDIGVTVLRSPITQCNPDGTTEVTVGITNFGGEAQQFFRLDFLVNGEPGGVNFPFDGIYTGVLGVDSTEYFTFDIQADLTQPGNYQFQVFTLLEEDEDSSNDTLTVNVVSVPRIADYPYLEDFETDAGFWRSERAGRGPSSWRRGRPRGGVIDRAGAGEFAYATNPRGTYNNNERSYLRSPCFNFSGLAADPYLSFLLYVDTEVNFDQLSLQSSVDDGSTWQTVERNPTAINWYNNGLAQAWDGDGGFGGGYALVGQQLDGLAGQENVQLRFVFRSDGDGQRDGVAIDNIRIAASANVDLAAVGARASGGESCGTLDSLTFIFTDLGRQRLDSTLVSYRVNGGEVVSQTFAAPATRGGRRTVGLGRPSVNVTPGDSIVVEAWVTAEGDGATYNDTTVLVYRPTSPVPFLVDFEDGRTPRNWEIGPGLVIGRRSGTASATLFKELTAADSIAQFATGFYGLFEAGDSVMLDIILTPTVAGSSLSAFLGTSFSFDCDDALLLGDTVNLVEGLNTISIPAGGYTAFSFSVVRQSGDFTVDFDNLRLVRCPANLGIKLTTVAPGGIFADDGQAFLEPSLGLAPYTYSWSTGDTTQSVDSLSVGTYEVTVTDALGCTDSRSVTVDLQAVATDEPGALLAELEIFPNPTGGGVSVQLTLPTALPLGLEVYDARGRRLEVRDLGRSMEVSTTVDLSGRPAGLYFLRVRAGEGARTVRVLRY